MNCIFASATNHNLLVTHNDHAVPSYFLEMTTPDPFIANGEYFAIAVRPGLEKIVGKRLDILNAETMEAIL
jgi:hypothetical protein